MSLAAKCWNFVVRLFVYVLKRSRPAERLRPDVKPHQMGSGEDEVASQQQNVMARNGHLAHGLSDSLSGELKTQATGDHQQLSVFSLRRDQGYPQEQGQDYRSKAQVATNLRRPQVIVEIAGFPVDLNTNKNRRAR